MQIFVHPPHGKIMTLNVGASDSVDVIKAKIQARIGCLANDQVLMMGGEVLMKTAKIVNQCAIRLIYQPCETAELELLREKDQADRKRRLTKLYDQLVVRLIHVQGEYKKWKLQVKGEHKLELGAMPLINVAAQLIPLFDFQFFSVQEMQNSQMINLLKGVVIEWLFELDSLADSDERIAGEVELRHLYQDTDKCTAVAELLILSKIYPSRAEILICETGLHIQTGSLREDVMLGRLPFLTTAADMLLEFLETGLSKGSSSELSAIDKKTYLSPMFTVLDFDADGLLSKDESLEFCRLMLSRPSLGRLLVTSQCVKSDPNSLTMIPLGRASLISMIPSVVLSFAEDCTQSVSENLWLNMDRDHHDEVTKQEFCDLFPISFEKAIVAPLRDRLAEKASHKKVPDVIFSNSPLQLNSQKSVQEGNRSCHCVSTDFKSWCLLEDRPPRGFNREFTDHQGLHSAEEFEQEERLKQELVEQAPIRIKQHCRPCANTACIAM
eukprot:gnl/MRDRNA2_/MRDRNA2_174926_c0_seq1.p1 gnl/MRDRNA2_/MRDRNA2_174926_c0~~gnl/MRDRNA2_/MRDRNA2_174926_c0_seq1.p1  ORF type:complete len:496 (+),score=107.62 gnl/MRDRNA2_/MRDRNA2_174926_c0_seq1:16-1503(+)